LASIHQSIEILGKEKGIDPQVILDAVKDALVVAARKHFRTNEDMSVDFDPKGGIQLSLVKRVVETVADPVNELTLEQAVKIDPKAQVGGEVRIAKNADALGRISAQTAKQVILQKVREAERETIYSEFSGRVGELVNCIVKRLEAQDMVVDLGKTEARLPKKEQSKLESFSVGDRMRCVIKSVEKSGKNAGVIVSRADAQLVVRLFEQEVPEIYDNTVVIKGCAREAGERTKIAVWSRDRDVDSVGACVGMKGMRVQSIIRELRGEKIDIIEYSEDAVAFATHALSPAKISRVAIVNPLDRHMEVIVDDSQLSLAIGKKGQNVRLAAKLLGWRIDIKSEEEKRQEVETAMAALVVPGAPVSVLSDYGLDETLLDTLFQAGVTTVEQLGSMTPEEVESLPGVGPEVIEVVQSAVVAYYSQFEEAHAEPVAGEPAAEASEETTEQSAAAEDPAAGEPVAQAGEETTEQSAAAEEPAVEQQTAVEPAEDEGKSPEDESARIDTPVEGAEGN
jgi:N utilization substance protein A